MDGFVNKYQNFEVNSLSDGEPMQIDEVGGYRVKFALPDDKSGCGALDILKTLTLSFTYAS